MTAANRVSSPGRRYRVQAEMREVPDLHKLTQLFLGMALARTEHGRKDPTSNSESVSSNGAGVESSQQEANG